MEFVTSIAGHLWLGMFTFWLGVLWMKAFAAQNTMRKETKQLIEILETIVRSSPFAFDGTPTNEFSDFSNAAFTTKVWTVNGQKQPHPFKISSCLLQDIRRQLISANMEHAKTNLLLQELIAFQKQVYGDPHVK